MKKSQEGILYYKEIAKLQKERDKLAKKCEEVADWIVPQVYACFLTVLQRGGLNQEQLADVVQQTQALWYESIDCIDDLVDQCSKETGIDLRMTAREKITQDQKEQK